MYIVSHETYITVTFDSPLDPQGVLNSVYYVLSNPGGGVPIAPLSITAIEAITVEQITGSMSGSSGLVAIPLSVPGVLIQGGSQMSAVVSGVTQIQATFTGGSSAAVDTGPVAPVYSSIAGVRIEVNKPTNGKAYTLQVLGLTVGGAPYGATGTFTASSSLPSVTSVEQLDEGQVVITFSDTMRIDSALLSPAEYSITGPTDVLIKTAQTVVANQVMLTTVGMASGSYTLEVNATGTPHDVAGNPIDPSFNQAIFTSSPAMASRSIFTDHGPISKPLLTLQSGSTAIITSQTQVTLPTANILPIHVGLYVNVSGTTANNGRYRITSRVSSTVVKLASSLHLPEPSNGTIVWSLIDPRDGQIADDPADVTVLINSIPVIPEAVIGLLGQVVLPTVPDPSDTVAIDYSWIQNPIVDFRRLNSKEFRLNNWNRDNGRPADSSAHKYRYNNTLIRPESFIALDIRAELDQPQQRDLKYRAYERAYSVALNDSSTLLLNSPNHRIAFPPMTRTLSSTFVNYQGAVLPESVGSDPWTRHGGGQASISASDLVVSDDSAGPFPDGDLIFWSRSIDLTFEHVFALAWRMRVDAVSTYDGVFTGVAAGYSDNHKAVVVGFLNAAGPKFGILRKGFGNDPSSIAAWSGGLDSAGNATGIPAAIDWEVASGYRIFRDRSGTISVYVDGSVVPSLRVTSDDLPYLEELNSPFNELQGPFFGSLSREAENTSIWNFVRYTSIPINPLQASPSVYVSYEGSTIPEMASQPWTPVGFHGTETIVTGSHLLLDSTSATDLPSFTFAGLISGDFRGFTRIEPLLSESFDTVLDVNVAIRTHTHGITPNAVMAALDDGDRLIQLSFLSDTSYSKISYGGRALPPDFSPYHWSESGTQSASMLGQYLRISDSSISDGLVYFIEDLLLVGDPARVIGYQNDYMLEFRVEILSYTTDIVGFAGVMASAYDSLRVVGIQLTEVLGQRYVELHSDGVPVSGGTFLFDWFGGFHTFRLTKSTGGDLVSIFIDGTFIGSTPYSNFSAPLGALTGMASFGSATPLSVQSTSTVLWAYANFWRFDGGARKYVGLWKGTDPEALTGYHLPTKAFGRSASVNGNVLTDPAADFVSRGVQSGDQLVIDDGPNKGVYTTQIVAPGADVTKLTIATIFPAQPSEVGYRVAMETDWSAQHRYRIVKDPSSGVSVFLDAVSDPLIHADYSNVSLPPSSVGLPQIISSGLPSVTWGAFDPTNISQSSWDYVRLGAVRSISELGIVPHHQVLNQRNVMASFEHHRTLIPHTHTDFWSESEGIPPQTEPDLLRDPNLVAFTLLNERTPLVPSTQTYEVRSPTPVLVSVAGLNQPANVLNDPGFLLNNAKQKVQILIPDDVLYNSLQVIERDTGSPDLIAPFDDESQPSFGPLFFQKEVCLTYDGSVLPENDISAASPWARVSDDPSHQFASAFSGILTYGTDATGTRTLYRNNTPLPDSIGLTTEVKFRLKLLQDSTGGLGDSQVRVGFSSPGVTVGLAFVTTPIGDRYVLAVDLNNGQTVGGIPFDFYDGAYHTYILTRDPGTASIQIRIDP